MWEDDKAHGKGKYMNSNGTEYDGDWVYDKQEGQGKQTWPDNSSYSGGYKDG